jgi:hypothetical protein
MRLFLAVTISAGIAWCQQAQIEGLVRDPTALNVAGAEINVRNELTGGHRETRTNESGFYSVASLNPGSYRVLIRHTGFETIVQEGVKLEVGENARLDFSLHIGDSRTIVTVQGGPPLINTEDASIGTVIGRDIIDEMPLNGRGIQNLIELTPGVEPVPVTLDNAGQFSVNGQHSVSNYFTVDGVSANFAAGVVTTQGSIGISQAGGAQLPANNLMGTFSNLVSPDALQEFKIQTSTFAPEFGRAPGAQIGFLTRSGTNRYSGSLFEYFRNDVFDANDWFSNQSGQPRPPLRFNNFGGTLGGPVRIPHLYRGDNRTFFFVSFEDLVMRQPQPASPFAVPTAQTRLSMSPLSAPLYDALPLPNLPPSSVNAAPGWAGFVQAFSLPTNQRTFGLRFDHYFSDKWIGFVRYNLAPSDVTQAVPLYPLTPFHTSALTGTLTAGVTESSSPALVNDLRANLSWQNIKSDAQFLPLNGAGSFPASLFPPGYSSQDSNVMLFDTSNPSIPNMDVGLFGAVHSRQIQAVDQLSYTRGTHQFKFGVDYKLFRIFSQQPRTSSTYEFADLPAGQVIDLIEEVTPSDVAYQVPAFSLYAQDTWHALQSLTVTYGLRWELEPAPRATSGDVAVYTLASLTGTSGLFAAPPDSPFYRTQFTNLAPRVGLAWQMRDDGNNKTVLRAGAGIFYDTAASEFASVNASTTNLYSYLFVPLGKYPSGAQPLESETVATVAAPGYTLPRTYEWNLSMEQSFGQQTFSAAYVGAIGSRLLGTFVTHLDSLSESEPSVLQISGNAFSSSYQAMQLQFNRRIDKRIRTLLSYTWSHSIDNLSDQLGLYTQGIAPLLDPNLNRGDSDFDVRQSLHGAVFFALPAPRLGPVAALLRNWTASSIFFARTALPVNVALLTHADVRPDLVPGQPLYLYGGGYPGGKSLNIGAFAAPPEGVEQGTLGRNALQGFGAWQADVALHRDFRLAEHTTMQFRCEAFNVFNHPNFANPGGLGACPSNQKSRCSATTSCVRNVLASLHAASKAISRTGS